MSPEEMRTLYQRWAVNVQRQDKAEAEEFRRVFDQARPEVLARAMDCYFEEGGRFQTLPQLRAVHSRLVAEALDRIRQADRQRPAAAPPAPEQWVGGRVSRTGPSAHHLDSVIAQALFGPESGRGRGRDLAAAGLVLLEDVEAVVLAGWPDAVPLGTRDRLEAMKRRLAEMVRERPELDGVPAADYVARHGPAVAG